MTNTNTTSKLAKDVTSYLINNHNCTFTNNFDGNMKLQKILVNANLIHLVREKTLLFEDDMYAFKNGIVVESIRKPFHVSYADFTEEVKEHDAELSEEEKKSIDLAVDLFYSLSATELSDLHHELETWKTCYNRSLIGSSHHHKPSGRINKERDFAPSDLERFKSVVEAYQSENDNYEKEVVNGITFFYDPAEIEVDDSVLEFLEDISRTVEPEDAPYFLTSDEDMGVYYY